MKKFLILMVVVICGTILFSCTEQGIDSGNQIIPDDEVIIPVPSPAAVNYPAIGFYVPFKIVPETVPMWGRTDGEIDPLRGTSFSNPSPSALSAKAKVLKEAFFDDPDYTFYGVGGKTGNFFYYPDVSYVDNSYQLNFYNHGIEPYDTLSIVPNAFVDGIVSNHETSYVINSKYLSPSGVIRSYFYKLFSAIYYDDRLPYRIYFNQDYIFLMSKEEGFSQKYLEKFTPENGVYLFKN
jgi:hypothetical protein